MWSLPVCVGHWILCLGMGSGSCGVAAPAWLPGSGSGSGILYAEYAVVGRGRMELPIYDTAAAGVTRTAVMPT
jgi:hypothetical protein